MYIFLVFFNVGDNISTRENFFDSLIIEDDVATPPPKRPPPKKQNEDSQINSESSKLEIHPHRLGFTAITRVKSR